MALRAHCVLEPARIITRTYIVPLYSANGAGAPRQLSARQGRNWGMVATELNRSVFHARHRTLNDDADYSIESNGIAKERLATILVADSITSSVR